MTPPAPIDPQHLQIDGLLRELARHPEPGPDEPFVAQVMQAVAGVEAAAPQRRWTRLMTVFAVAAALVLAVVLVRLIETPPYRLVEAHQVQVQREGRMIETDRPRQGDALLVAAGGTARLRWADGSEVDLVGPAAASLPPAEPGRDSAAMRIDTGLARFRVAAQAPGSTFTVTTSQATVAVEGTVFDLRSEQGRTAVALREGAVRVRDAVGREVRLVPGEEALAPSGGTLSVQVAADVPAIFRERFTDPGLTWRGDGVAWERRWFDVDGQWRHTLALHADTGGGEVSLPLPELPDRLRLIVHLRAARPGSSAAIILGAEDGLDLTAALASGAWTRLHLRLIDGRIVVEDGAGDARWPADGDFRLHLRDVALDIADIVVLPEEQP